MTPEVPAIARWVERGLNGPYWRLTIECPYCSKIHTHGGGEDPAKPSYGQRTVHCADPIAKLPETDAGYVLVPA